jgi:endo-1,4-beta-xylanase
VPQYALFDEEQAQRRLMPTMLYRRDFLAGAMAASLISRATANAADQPLPLRVAAAARSIRYGCAIAAPQILSPDDFTALVCQECAVIVPENAMKWFEMSDAPDRTDFSIPDQIANFARARNLKLRGHTLLWYWRTPTWFHRLPDRGSAETAMLRRIRDMAGRYRGQVDSWDVVNEPLNPADGRSDNLREAVFLKQIGAEYLDLAYHAAREADSGARLVVNEYDVEYDTPDQDAKRTAVLRLLERMKTAGTPVDALGVQAHLDIGRYSFSATKLRRFLAEVAAMGLEIQITELDVTDERAPASIAERDQLVADEYRRFLDVALDEPAVTQVITWGLSDRHSWIVRRETNEMKWRSDGLPSRPLPFDVDLLRKPAWSAIARAFEQAPPRGRG